MMSRRQNSISAARSSCLQKLGSMRDPISFLQSYSDCPARLSWHMVIRSTTDWWCCMDLVYLQKGLHVSSTYAAPLVCHGHGNRTSLLCIPLATQAWTHRCYCSCRTCHCILCGLLLPTLRCFYQLSIGAASIVCSLVLRPRAESNQLQGNQHVFNWNQAEKRWCTMQWILCLCKSV